MSVELLRVGEAQKITKLIGQGNRLRFGSSGARAIGYGVLTDDFDSIASRLFDGSDRHIHTYKGGAAVDAFRLAKPLFATIEMVELIETEDPAETGVTQVHYTVTPKAFDRIVGKTGDQYPEDVKELHGLHWKKFLIGDNPLAPHIKLRDHTIIELFESIEANRS
jgi:hypothetical protein